MADESRRRARTGKITDVALDRSRWQARAARWARLPRRDRAPILPFSPRIRRPSNARRTSLPPLERRTASGAPGRRTRRRSTGQMRAIREIRTRQRIRPTAPIRSTRSTAPTLSNPWTAVNSVRRSTIWMAWSYASTLSTVPYASPLAAPTAALTTAPAWTLSPSASDASARSAFFQPRPASARTYGMVAFVRA